MLGLAARGRGEHPIAYNGCKIHVPTRRGRLVVYVATLCTIGWGSSDEAHVVHYYYYLRQDVKRDSSICYLHFHLNR